VARYRCSLCNHTGYHGRTGIHELFTIDDTLRRLTHEGVGEQTLCTAAIQAGMAIMWEDGARWVQTGLTSIEEIIRVTRDIQ